MKLEYIDLKNAVDRIKEELANTERALELHKISLRAFEAELAKVPKPKKQVAS